MGEQIVKLKSDNQKLQDAFHWAVEKTKCFVMTGKHGIVNKDENFPKGDGTGEKNYIPSYWAGYFDRTAFYSRDYAHQMEGAHLVGLDLENYTMMKVFAENATEERKWFTLWAVNFDGTPHWIDYKNDDYFVREIPAQFELVEKAYKAFLWTGDDRYIYEPAMWLFYSKVLTDFIELHDNIFPNGIAEGTGKHLFDGVASYNEQASGMIEAGDGIGCQYQAFLAYVGMLEARGEEKEADKWHKKAEEFRRFFNEEWSVPKENASTDYICMVLEDGSRIAGYSKEISWFMLMKQIMVPGERCRAYLNFIDKVASEFIEKNGKAQNIESLTYLPDTHFMYNRNEDAWRWMKFIIEHKDIAHIRPTQGTNGDYPEVSFTLVSQTVEGIMGVQPNAKSHKVATLPRLPKEIGWVEVENVMIGDHNLRIRHDANKKTTLENIADTTIYWEARFYGGIDKMKVNGKEKTAQRKKINNEIISFIEIETIAGGRTVVEAY